MTTGRDLARKKDTGSPICQKDEGIDLRHSFMININGPMPLIDVSSSGDPEVALREERASQSQFGWEHVSESPLQYSGIGSALQRNGMLEMTADEILIKMTAQADVETHDDVNLDDDEFDRDDRRLGEFWDD